MLYEQLVKIRFVLGNRARPLPTEVNELAPSLPDGRLSWPQLQDLRSLHLQLHNIPDETDIRALQEEVTALLIDLAIWIVENYFRPRSPAEVNLLRPDFHRAGIGYILYGCYEREREWCTEEEHKRLRLLFEYWIDSVWDGKIKVPLPVEISTVGQLITYLAERDARVIHHSIAHVIEEFKLRL